MSTEEELPSLRSVSLGALASYLESIGPLHLHLSHRTMPPSDLASNKEHRAEVSLDDLEPRRLPRLPALSHSILTVERLETRDVKSSIERFLRAKGFSYTVDPERSCIECTTPCCLSFAIYLWLNDRKTLLVELQRRSGCAVLMQKIHTELFRCIETGEEPTTCDLRACPTERRVSLRVKQLMPEIENEMQHDVQEAIETCETYLCSERHDLNQLAMESLVSLTDTNTSPVPVAQSVAERILCKVSPDAEFSLHEDFVHALCASARHARRKSYDGLEDPSYKDGQKERLMTVLSVSVLRNALTISRTYEEIRIDRSLSSWQRIAACLQSIVCNAASNPQAAFLARECLHLLMDVDDGLHSNE